MMTRLRRGKCAARRRPARNSLLQVLTAGFGTKGEFAAQQQAGPFPGVFLTLFGALQPVLLLTLKTGIPLRLQPSVTGRGRHQCR
jgi:hypothetical protein